MKKRSLFLLTLLAANVSWADTALFVHPKSGGVLEIAFSEKPVVTYEEGNLIITASGSYVVYPLSNMDKFTFGEVDENVTRIVAPANVAPQPTYIYNVSGVLVRTYKPNNDGTTSTSLEGLPAGTYVIKNGKTAYKMQKR